MIQLNHSYLKSYFLKGFFTPLELHNQTMFQGELREVPRSDFKEKTSNLSFKEAQNAFKYHLQEAADSCIPKEGKLAVELSGGLDSSCIAYLSRRKLPKSEIHAFTHTTPGIFLRDNKQIISGIDYDESPWSRRVAKKLNLKQVFLNKEQNLHELIEESTEILNHFSEVLFPLLNLPFIKLAKKLGIKTILSGFGGDEVVSGSGILYIQELKDQKKVSELGLRKKP